VEQWSGQNPTEYAFSIQEIVFIARAPSKHHWILTHWLLITSRPPKM